MSQLLKHFDALSSEAATQLELLVGQFEQAWLNGLHPTIDSYLPNSDGDRTPVLLELIITDMEYRLRHNEPVSVGRYLLQYPDLSHQPEAVSELEGTFQSLQQHRTGEASSKADLVGQIWMERFQILDIVGSGSSSTVYRARDNQLDRIVAVKVPRQDGLAMPVEIDRFLREARSVAHLRHSGIVPVHDAGLSAGSCYLVTEFLTGGTLAGRLAKGNWSFREAAECLSIVAEALHYAHEQGVIHRDLKPSNILLDENGRPHVADFGLALDAGGEATLTIDGQVLGTPAYMSPEQAHGDAHRVDARSDVYSLGVILYEMLTGSLPFRGNSRMLLAQVLEEEPRPPRRINDSIPRDLETICLKAMAKESSRRYQTASEMTADLRRFLDGRPVLARPVSSLVKVGRWCRRRPTLATLAALLCVVTLTGLAVVAWQWHQAQAQFEESERRRRAAEENFQLARQAVSDFTRLLEQHRRSDIRFRPLPEDYFLARDALTKALKYYEDFLEQRPDDPFRKADVARTYQELAVYIRRVGGPASESMPPMQKAGALWEELVARHPDVPQFRQRLADYFHSLGNEYRIRGDFLQARGAFEKSLDLMHALARDQKAGPHLQSRLAKCYSDFARVRETLGHQEEAIRLHGESIRLQLQLVAANSAAWEPRSRLARFYYLYGDGQRQAGHLTTAIEAFDSAIKLYEQFPEPGRDINSRFNLSRCYYYLGELHREMDPDGRSRRNYEHARDRFETLAREEPTREEFRRSLGLTYHRLGDIHRSAGRIDASLDAYQRCCRSYEQLVDLHAKLARTAPDVIQYRALLGMTYLRMGTMHDNSNRYPEALASYHKARETYEELWQQAPTNSSFQVNLGTIYHNIGRTHGELGQPGAAIPFFERALPIRERLARKESKYNRDLAGTLHRLGEVLARAGRREQATAALERSAEIKQRLVNDHPNREDFQLQLSEVRQVLERLREERRDP